MWKEEQQRTLLSELCRTLVALVILRVSPVCCFGSVAGRLFGVLHCVHRTVSIIALSFKTFEKKYKKQLTQLVIKVKMTSASSIGRINENTNVLYIKNYLDFFLAGVKRKDSRRVSCFVCLLPYRNITMTVIANFPSSLNRAYSSSL